MPSSAVVFRMSSVGLTSTRSNDVSLPDLGDHLHHDVRLAIAEAALDRRADAGRNASDRRHRDRTRRESRRCRASAIAMRAFHHLGDAEAIDLLHREHVHLRRAHDLLLDLVEVADADEHRVLRRAPPARRRAKCASSAGSAPSSAASGMPCTLPDSLDDGIVHVAVRVHPDQAERLAAACARAPAAAATEPAPRL